MSTLFRLSPAAFAALALFGCDQLQLPPGEPGADGLIATHVGGHLGSYRDCPEQAFENQGADRAVMGIRDGAGSDADCDGACGPLNCEAARLTFTLSNDSDVIADGVEPIALFILDREGIEVVELPIAAALDRDGQPFDGHLEPGEEALVHVEFVGPFDVTAFVPREADGDGIGWQNGAQIRLLVGSTTHEDTGLDTPELFSLPEVDT